MGYRRSKRHSDFHGSADYGYCAARKMKYFGYKLVMLSTVEGLPIAYDLVPANTDEREALESFLEQVRGCDIYGDKGFIGQDWQEQITQCDFFFAASLESIFKLSNPSLLAKI